VCIDVKALRVLQTFDAVGPRPWGVALSPAGDRLYTANGPSDDVSVIDLQSGRVLRRIAAGKSPWGVVVAP
jgi:YVTN family beta-propeller protein